MELLQTKAVPALQDTERWLDHYFKGKQPDFLPPLRLQGTTFRREVWQLLLHIHLRTDLPPTAS
jgi:methylated-DNA-[protein]-cysteine S-methyltransferase